MKNIQLSGASRWAWICWGAALAALLAIFAADAAWLRGQKTFVTSPEGETLSASYYPGSQAGGVLLLEGFGSDQLALRSAVRELARQGWHIFTFDFSGHSRSPGTLGFDNAQTDRLAYQTLSALDQFQALSGLERKQILVMGHSLGARVALQTAVLTSEPPVGLILLGAQVNLSSNTQSEFFTGTSDADLEWVQSLGATQPGVPLVLISGSWDDILTPEAARLLLNKLSVPFSSSTPTPSNPRKWILIPGLLHNYEIISPRALTEAVVWGGEILNLPVDRSGSFAAARIGLWVLAAGAFWAGLLLAGSGGDVPPHTDGPVIVSTRRFLWGKLLLWLPALPLAALVSGAVFALPLGKPVINLIYVGFIGAYGILLSVLYRLGRMPGVQGKLAREGFPSKTGARLSLLAVFTPPTALGFWIGLREADWLRRDAPDQRWVLLWHAVIGLVPFFIYAIFLGLLGSLSGLAGSLQGLVVLGWVLAYGRLMQRLTGLAWLTAVMQSLLLYWLILPQGVLF